MTKVNLSGKKLNKSVRRKTPVLLYSVLLNSLNNSQNENRRHTMESTVNMRSAALNGRRVKGRKNNSTDGG